MRRRFDLELMATLALKHPELRSKRDMVRNWRTRQSLPSLRTVLEVLNHSKVSPNKLFPEDTNGKTDKGGTGGDKPEASG